MTLAAGTRLGPYEVLALIGAGGMGEVYTAKDTRLDRIVAVKVLPADISTDPNRRARFEREAKAVAALSHPHICTVHDVGEHAGSMFLVMERLNGETLAARLARGPVPIAQALTIAVEITEALAAAHRQGIIHRDLKPSNVMLTRSGAKLLDFGLAKLTAHGEQPAIGQAGSAPTQSPPLTAEGAIAGTLQYMAPEQLEGKPADARTDVWAVGAVIYEMLTGTRAFEGRSAVAVIAAILETEPTPASTLQPLTPPALDRVVRLCLSKSPDDRPDTAHDLANDLRWTRETIGAGALTAHPAPTRRWLLRAAAVVLGAVALSGAVTSWLWARWRAPGSSAPVVRSELDVRPAEELNAGSSTGWAWMPTLGGSHTAMAWTPDGQALLFIGRRGGTRQLYERALDRDEARPLAGTEGAQVLAVSSDGQWVAFWAKQTLKKVPRAGGPVIDVASGIETPPMGLNWDDHGTLYFARAEDRRIWKVSPDGGLSVVTTGGDTDWAEILPWPLPGGQAVLYTTRKREWSWGDEEIVAQALATGARKVLLRDAADARYVATGHLVFLRRGVLFAVAFDPDRLEVRGTPEALFDGVVQALTGIDSDDVTGAGQFAIAPTGALALVRGPVVSYPSQGLVSVDRHGRVSPLAAPHKSYIMGTRLAPGREQVAVAVRDLGEVSVWTYDLARGTAMPLPIARGGEAYLQVWTRDGQHLVFHWLKDGRSSLALQRADGTSPPEVLDVGAGAAPSSWTPDGRLVVVTYGKDLAVVTIENGRATLQPLMQTPYIEAWPEVSPDGRWLAYGSNSSGRNEVYVQPFPGPGPRTQVSIDGGESPAWQANGRELFFISLPEADGARRMKVTRFDPESPPRIGAAEALFEFAPGELKFFCGTVRCYDIAPDGQRFYVVRTPTPPPPPVVTHISLIQNWFEELRARVPAEKPR